MTFGKDPCYLEDKKQKQQAIVFYVQFPVCHHDWIAVSEVFVSVVKLSIWQWTCQWIFLCWLLVQRFRWGFWVRWSCHKVLTHISELFLSLMLTYIKQRERPEHIQKERLSPRECLSNLKLFSTLDISWYNLYYIFTVFSFIRSLVLWYHVCHYM